ncbi:hypothetical protein BDR07DRAFT_979417 [Suillus spraguei]|nr:hypothetical protein BDR07DRAFT_979417 [Suillus spraguei]
MSDVFTLNSWVRGTDIDRGFSVEISRFASVAALKKVVEGSSGYRCACFRSSTLQAQGSCGPTLQGESSQCCPI